MSTDETAQTAMDRMRRAMEKAAREFEPFGRPDTDFFKNALRYPDPAVRSLAVTVLCRVQDTRAINLLIEAMQDAGDETAALGCVVRPKPRVFGAGFGHVDDTGARQFLASRPPPAVVQSDMGR